MVHVSLLLLTFGVHVLLEHFCCKSSCLTVSKFQWCFKMSFSQQISLGWGDERNSSFQKILPWRWTLIHHQSNEGKKYPNSLMTLDGGGTSCTKKGHERLDFPGVNWFFVGFQRLQVRFAMILKNKECFSLRKTHTFNVRLTSFSVELEFSFVFFVTKIRWHAEAWSTRSPGPRW